MLVQTVLDLGIARSKRQLSKMLGRAPNYVCETRGALDPYDLIKLRLMLLDAGHDKLAAVVTRLILEPWDGH